MRNLTLAVTAIAAALAVTAPAKNATAMPIATADQIGLAGAAGTVEETAVVCGPWGCAWRPGIWGGPAPYWGWRRRYWGGPGWGWGGPGWGWRGPGWGWRGPGWGWRRW